MFLYYSMKFTIFSTKKKTAELFASFQRFCDLLF
jgi:hypothetical protein